VCGLQLGGELFGEVESGVDVPQPDVAFQAHGHQPLGDAGDSSCVGECDAFFGRFECGGRATQRGHREGEIGERDAGVAPPSGGRGQSNRLAQVIDRADIAGVGSEGPAKGQRPGRRRYVQVFSELQCPRGVVDRVVVVAEHSLGEGQLGVDADVDLSGRQGRRQRQHVVRKPRGRRTAT
jgi:hypothetical protein